MMPWYFWVIVGLLPAVAVGFPWWLNRRKRQGGE